jgi:hypothetical protein
MVPLRCTQGSMASVGDQHHQRGPRRLWSAREGGPGCCGKQRSDLPHLRSASPRPTGPAWRRCGWDDQHAPRVRRLHGSPLDAVSSFAPASRVQRRSSSRAPHRWIASPFAIPRLTRPNVADPRRPAARSNRARSRELRPTGSRDGGNAWPQPPRTPQSTRPHGCASQPRSPPAPHGARLVAPATRERARFGDLRDAVIAHPLDAVA